VLLPLLTAVAFIAVRAPFDRIEMTGPGAA
jgi:hypothetical protein